MLSSSLSLSRRGPTHTVAIGRRKGRRWSSLSSVFSLLITHFRHWANYQETEGCRKTTEKMSSCTCFPPLLVASTWYKNYTFSFSFSFLFLFTLNFLCHSFLAISLSRALSLLHPFPAQGTSPPIVSIVSWNRGASGVPWSSWFWVLPRCQRSLKDKYDAKRVCPLRDSIDFNSAMLCYAMRNCRRNSSSSAALKW